MYNIIFGWNWGILDLTYDEELQISLLPNPCTIKNVRASLPGIHTSPCSILNHMHWRDDYLLDQRQGWKNGADKRRSNNNHNCSSSMSSQPPILISVLIRRLKQKTKAVLLFKKAHPYQLFKKVHPYQLFKKVHPYKLLKNNNTNVCMCVCHYFLGDD